MTLSASRRSSLFTAAGVFVFGGIAPLLWALFASSAHASTAHASARDALASAGSGLDDPMVLAWIGLTAVTMVAALVVRRRGSRALGDAA